jgi:mannose-1-phosphate guanylyltransferase/mannose-1-phosphate guanylyltransferase/phosphomannomutase
MKALILAAGLGTRLRPLTNILPKPMVPVCNRPIIARIIDALIAEGVSDFIVNLHHLPEMIERYLPDAFPDARFAFSFEPQILGTGGAIRKVRALLDAEDDFFVINGDTIERPPLAALRDVRRATNALAAMTLRHPPAGDRYTAVWLERDRITGFGKGRGEALMYSGAQCVSARIFEHLPNRDVSELVSDVYLSTNEPLAGVLHDDPIWFDVGTLQRYLGATSGMLAAMVRGEIAVPPHSHLIGNSLVHDSATIGGTMTRSVAGARSVVKGSLEASAVFDDCTIDEGAELQSCIVASGVKVVAHHTASILT